MVENGLADTDDMPKERIAGLRLGRERTQAALDRVRVQTVLSDAIPPEIVEQFGRTMRENIRIGDVPFRKAYLRSVIERVEVDDATIRIVGETATLEQVVAGTANAAEAEDAGALGVRRSVRKWCTRQDSNL